MILRHPNDTLVTGFAPRQKFIAAFADVTETTHAIADLHGCSPASEWVLAHTLAATALLGAPLSTDGESVALRIDATGPAGGAYAEYSHGGGLRGYVARKALPEPSLPYGAAANAEPPWSDALGDSFRVKTFWERPAPSPDTLGSFRLTPPSYRALVELHFMRALHLPTWARFRIRMDDAGVESAMAFMLQCRPDGDLPGFVGRESAFSEEGGLASVFDDPVIDAVRAALEIDDLAIGHAESVAFRCECSRPGSLLALVALHGADALRATAESGGVSSVTCPFCGATYEFPPEELCKILPPSDQQEGASDTSASSGDGDTPALDGPAQTEES